MLTAVLKIKWCDLVKMDALLLAPPVQPSRRRRATLKVALFLKHKLQRQIYGVLREHYEWHLIKEK